MNDAGDTRQARPQGLLIISALLAAFSVFTALRANSVTSQYRELFHAFGAPVSPLTEFVLQMPNVWWFIAAPAVGVFLWIARRASVTPAQRVRMKQVLLALLVVAASLYGLAMYALHKPLWDLGSPI